LHVLIYLENVLSQEDAYDQKMQIDCHNPVALRAEKHTGRSHHGQKKVCYA